MYYRRCIGILIKSSGPVGACDKLQRKDRGIEKFNDIDRATHNDDDVKRSQQIAETEGQFEGN